jgi:hypothetical protein
VQSLENARNAERISILPERVSEVAADLPVPTQTSSRSGVESTGRTLQKKAPNILKSLDAKLKWPVRPTSRHSRYCERSEATQGPHHAAPGLLRRKSSSQ